jgi:formate hydrogenlyase subunit 4
MILRTEHIVVLAYILLGPLVGGLMAGVDRKLTARLQGRIGPPLLQPFYDLSKLFSKSLAPVNRLQLPLVASHLFFAFLTGVLFFWGSDILLIIFVLTLAEIFLVLAAYSTGSPYGSIGADRELLLMTAYEPMVILTLVGLYEAARSFNFYEIFDASTLLIFKLPGVYLGLLMVLVMKLQKSPFDISTSHHAHQELVKGLTVDLGGPALGLVELAHWYESVYLYAIVFLFFSASIWVALAGVAVTFFLVILIDNITARVTWQTALASAWIVALVMGAGNLIPFYLITRGQP